MSLSILSRILSRFQEKYGTAPQWVVRAPGRVNLIGEHTDYNDGFVLPMAIDRATWVALRPRADRHVHIESLDFPQLGDFALDGLTNTASGWVEYVKGVGWAYQQAGYSLHGWEGVLASDVPIGAGLSSSAALELSIARSFAVVGNWEWDAIFAAQMARKADNEFVGVQSGIMDQMISACGKSGCALLIDCRSLESQIAHLPPNTSVVVLDTATRRGLAKSAYNDRVRECRRAADFLGVSALRSASLAQLSASGNGLDEIALRRARHVISENERTLQAVQAMEAGDAVTLGALMDASHASLRDDYEVSCLELDTIVTLARQQPGCYGARMTGAGFGGCAIALVQSEYAQALAQNVAQAYQEKLGKQGNFYVCVPSNGAEVVQ